MDELLTTFDARTGELSLLTLNCLLIVYGINIFNNLELLPLFRTIDSNTIIS